MNKLASLGFLNDINGVFYECKFQWPENCYVQCGDNGLVLSPKGNYHTAFFEAFPKESDEFIRGEGDSIQKAEEMAWFEYMNIIN